MLYEFAMTPEVFDQSVHGSDTSLGIILVEILRGISENGLLANLNKDRWARHVVDERTVNLSPGLRDKVIACLNALESRHRLVRHPKRPNGNPTTDMEWLELALASHSKVPFHAIILSQILLDAWGSHQSFVEFSDTLNSPHWAIRRNRSLSLVKTPTEYRTALAVILRHAKALDLVDPYMNC